LGSKPTRGSIAAKARASFAELTSGPQGYALLPITSATRRPEPTVTTVRCARAENAAESATNRIKAAVRMKEPLVSYATGGAVLSLN